MNRCPVLSSLQSIIDIDTLERKELNMGFYASLEIDNGENLPIRNENNINMGNPLIAFLEMYSGWEKYDEESEKYQWFQEVENKARTSPRILTEIYYGGELLNYPDDYDQFVKTFGDPISEPEFKKMMDIEKTWKPISVIIPAVEEILRLLPLMGENTYWYSTTDTPEAFQALLKTLKLAQKRGGKNVRIQVF
jgi:hypothetical protein